MEETVEEDLLLLLFLDFFPVDFLFLVWMVSLQSVSGRLNCVCVHACVCVCVCVCVVCVCMHEGKREFYFPCFCTYHNKTPLTLKSLYKMGSL